MSQLPTGQELENKAKELGVATQGNPRTTSTLTRTSGSDKASDHESQGRILEAERAQRERLLTRVAVVSAVVTFVSAAASVISAIAAIIAVSK